MEETSHNESKPLLERVFSMYTCSDSLLPNISNVFLENGRIFATDAHSIIYIEEENYVGDFVINDKAPSCSKFVFEPNSNTRIEIVDLEVFKTEDEYKKDGNDVECRTCKGLGEVEWSFEYHTKDDDCPTCNGLGYSHIAKEIPTGNKEFGLSFIEIKGTLFNIDLIDRLFETAKMLYQEIYLIHIPEKPDGYTFKIGKVNVLVMPCYRSDNDNVVLTIE